MSSPGAPGLFDRREDGVAEQVFESRPPTVVEFLEGGHDARRDLIDAARIGAGQRIERDDVFCGSLEHDGVVRAVLGNQPDHGVCQVAPGAPGSMTVSPRPASMS